nr:MAG TPA: hypothetical protein [Caudoviricetes sp.]
MYILIIKRKFIFVIINTTYKHFFTICKNFSNNPYDFWIIIICNIDVIAKHQFFHEFSKKLYK